MGVFFKNRNVSDPYYKTWLLIFSLAAVFAALDSIVVLFTPLENIYAGLIGDSFAVWLAIATVIIYLLLIDYPLSVFFPTSIEEMIKANTAAEYNEARARLARGTFGYCVIAILTTISITFFMRHSSVALSVKAPQLEDTETITSTLLKQAGANVASIESSISDIKTNKQKAVSKSKTKELSRLEKTGNVWASEQIEIRTKAAAKPYEAKAQKLESEKLDLMKEQNETLNNVVNAVNLKNQFLITAYNQKTQTLSDFLMWFAVGATLLQLYAGFMLANYRATFKIGRSRSLFDHIPNTEKIPNIPTPKKTYTVYTEDEKEVIREDVDGGKYGYIQYFVKVHDMNRYYDPTQFINWLRNSYNRKSADAKERLKSLRADLLEHILIEKDISKQITDYIEKNPDIVGEQVYNTFTQKFKVLDHV